MADFKEGDVMDTDLIHLDRFHIRGTKRKHVDAAESIRIVEVPDNGKPVAVIEEWSDDTDNKNDLLGGHL